MNHPASRPWLPVLDGRPGPLYRAIATALNDDIQSGRLPPGTRLPTHRDLAWDLKVTVGTVTRAYQEAERLGLIGGEVGRGTFVRDPGQVAHGQVEPPAGGVIDLAVNVMAPGPDLALLRDSLDRVSARADLGALMSYQPPLAPECLRQPIGRWITRTSGPEVAVERLLLTCGGQGAMHAALAAITRPGDTVLVEQLSYAGIRNLAQHLGLRLVPVAMDAQGLLPDAVEQAARAHGAHALYCMPTLQNPTTTTLPPDRRHALVSVARRTGLMLVEDDVYGFLTADPPPTLVELAPDVTIHVGSVSKGLFPGLRCGYVLPPRPLVDKVAQVMRATLLTPSHLGSLATADLVESGAAWEIVERRRQMVAERQALARRIFGNRLGNSSPAGTHLWLPLDAPQHPDSFTREALDRGIRVTPADAFTMGRGETANAVRICLCGVERPETLDHCLRLLADLTEAPAAAEAALV